jgi:hypothetical protein
MSGKLDGVDAWAERRHFVVSWFLTSTIGEPPTTAPPRRVIGVAFDRRLQDHEGTAMSKYSRSSDVIATDLGIELILLDPRNGEMFGLNTTGRRIWLDLPRSEAELADRLCLEFAVSPERARVDVKSLFVELTKAGLVHDNSQPSW